MFLIYYHLCHFYFGDESVLQFDGVTFGHTWGNASGIVANRVTLKACTGVVASRVILKPCEQARNEGTNLGHPWGNVLGVVANLEACAQARDEGHDLAYEVNEIIREASK